jgi:hypothetical protein
MESCKLFMTVLVEPNNLLTVGAEEVAKRYTGM